ncbi:hypothetical protein CEXT_665951, partial [Caerostris extrusa]
MQKHSKVKPKHSSNSVDTQNNLNYFFGLEQAENEFNFPAEDCLHCSPIAFYCSVIWSMRATRSRKWVLFEEGILEKNGHIVAYIIGDAEKELFKDLEKEKKKERKSVEEQFLVWV